MVLKKKNPKEQYRQQPKGLQFVRGSYKSREPIIRNFFLKTFFSKSTGDKAAETETSGSAAAVEGLIPFSIGYIQNETKSISRSPRCCCTMVFPPLYFCTRQPNGHLFVSRIRPGNSIGPSSSLFSIIRPDCFKNCLAYI